MRYFINKIYNLNLIIVLSIFFLDRLSKIYIIKKTEETGSLIVFLSEYLNLQLVWNKGIAFGLFSFNEAYLYNILSLIISIIVTMLVVMSLKSQGFKRYSLLMIIGGAIGNLHDRIFFKAVPDFIDFHINDFHWFIFNVSDIFITFGVIFMIVLEITSNKKEEL